MPLTINSAREQLADAIGDPLMVKVNRDHLLNFLHRASRDLRNSGWYLPVEPALVALESDIFEYDVPANFAYINQIRIGDLSYDNTGNEDSGVDVNDAGGIGATDTTVIVTDSSIFVVNDHIQLDDEVMLITANAGATETLTIRRAQFGTTAAAHADAINVLRPLTDVDYDEIVPRAYWYLKLATGGMSAAQAARGSRPIIVFNEDFFSFTATTPIQIHGQRRPTETYASGDTLDDHIESFVLDRATAYAAQFLRAQGDAPGDLINIAREAYVRSEQFLRLHPQEFRMRPNSTRVPGR